MPTIKNGWMTKMTKTQKCRYLENETFFLQMKKIISIHQGYIVAKNSFVGEVTFKVLYFYCFFYEI